MGRSWSRSRSKTASPRPLPPSPPPPDWSTWTCHRTCSPQCQSCRDWTGWRSSVYRLVDSPQSTGQWTVLSLQETFPVTCPLAQFESSCSSAILNVPLSPGCQVDWGLSLPVHQSAQVLPVLYYITPAPLHPGSPPGFTASACTTPAWQTSLPVRRNSGRRGGGGGCDN